MTDTPDFIPKTFKSSQVHATRKKLSELPTGIAPVHEDSDNYYMEHPNRGTCLVFNHATYGDQTPKRTGTQVDVKRIQKTFGGLGFSVEVCNDYKCREIQKKIKTLSEQDHTDDDCVCVIVLTHGRGDNMIQAKDDQYPLNTLWEPFTSDKCISLAGKPKLFFISACRGDKLDKGVRLQYMPRSAARYRSVMARTSVPSSYVIPNEADFLFGFSTPPGYYSWRNEQEGTWYIQSLCEVLDEYAATTDLVNILTKTAQMVTRRSSFHDQDKRWHNNKQVPEFHSRLLRSVYFTPKKQDMIVSETYLPKEEAAVSDRSNSKPEALTSHTKKPKSQHCVVS